MTDPDAATPGIDLEAVGDYLAVVSPGLFSGPLTAQLIPGGKSNLTYAVTDGTREVILRRPPLGHVLATAHDMTREFRVMTALAVSPVPVPTTYALCPDSHVIGAPFYVMERVAGLSYRRASDLEGLGPEVTARIAGGLIDALVALHGVDYTVVGLADFGRPEGFLVRQVARWGTQLAASRSRDLADADRLHADLAATSPPDQRPAIVHGDYRLDNVLILDGRVSAVLDWEMATLGDPLTDLGVLQVYDEVARAFPDAIGDIGTAPGYLSMGDQLDRYAAGSGRDVSDLDWYVAFGYFKLGVILEGLHYRHLHGQTVGQGFDEMGRAAPSLFSAGRQALARLV